MASPSEAQAPSATVRRRIEWADTDASGRYHYGTAIRLFEAAECELLEALGLLGPIYESMPRARVCFEYRRVLRFMDEVDSTVAVAELGTSSIRYSFELRRGGELCVEGELVAVHVDDEGKPAPWREEHRRLLAP